MHKGAYGRHRTHALGPITQEREYGRAASVVGHGLLDDLHRAIRLMLAVRTWWSQHTGRVREEADRVPRLYRKEGSVRVSPRERSYGSPS